MTLLYSTVFIYNGKLVQGYMICDIMGFEVQELVQTCSLSMQDRLLSSTTAGMQSNTSLYWTRNLAVDL